MTDFTKTYKPVAEQFQIEGIVQSVAPYGEGHINLTLLVTTDKKRYILQKMNTRVFPDSDALMKNICAVTKHLKDQGAETLEVIPTQSGDSYLRSENNYRMYAFIENTVTYQLATDKDVFEDSGRAFGQFQNLLASFDASVLNETIPQFHDTPKRYRDFCAALEKDAFDRAKLCRSETEFVLAHKDTFSKITDGLKDGSVPLRVTHNDTKLNNILMDAVTHKARAVIDLDTVMSGSMLYDFGDSIRFGASTAAEDETDLSKVHFSTELFEAYARGYLNAVKDNMTEREIQLLPYGAYLMTIECGMRFLTDYLSGNVYFATKYEEHNLVRCRTQFSLAKQMKERFPETDEIVRKIISII